MQWTYVNNVCSQPDVVECGVAQGSILGPLLFLCYINDLPEHLLHCTPSLYADDMALCFTSNNLDEIARALNAELQNIYYWFCRNKLSVNTAKTKYMLFHSRRKFNDNDTLRISMNNVEIEQVTVLKYLGVHLDSFLTFDHHVDAVA